MKLKGGLTPTPLCTPLYMCIVHGFVSNCCLNNNSPHMQKQEWEYV